MPLVEIKEFNALIDNKPFFDQPIKNKQGAYEKPIEMPRNNNYAIPILLDFSYQQDYYKLIGIDLSRQINTNIPQQINFTGKLEVLYCSKAGKNILFFLDSLIVTD